MIKEKIVFRREACTGCGLCARVCSSAAIVMNDKTPVQAWPARCSACGHCAAICPAGVITANPESGSRQFWVEKPAENLSPVELLLRKKRSVREFKSAALDASTLAQMITYAEKAPSSSNQRHRLYGVVTSKEKLVQIEKAVVDAFQAYLKFLNPLFINSISLFSRGQGESLWQTAEDIRFIQAEYAAGRSPIFRGAPCVVFIAAPKTDVQARDDCIIAQQYMMLYAESQGIGSCIIGYAQYAHGAMEKCFSLPRSYVIYSVGIFGYPRYTYQNEIHYEKPVVIWDRPI